MSFARLLLAAVAGGATTAAFTKDATTASVVTVKGDPGEKGDKGDPGTNFTYVGNAAVGLAVPSGALVRDPRVGADPLLYLNATSATVVMSAIADLDDAETFDPISITVPAGEQGPPGQNPVGTIIFSAAPGVPEGYLPCMGGLYSRNTYAALYDKIGSTYGAGNGVSTFAVPDYRGRYLVGVGTGTLEAAQPTAYLPTATALGNIPMGGTTMVARALGERFGAERAIGGNRSVLDGTTTEVPTGGGGFDEVPNTVPVPIVPILPPSVAVGVHIKY